MSYALIVYLVGILSEIGEIAHGLVIAQTCVLVAVTVVFGVITTFEIVDGCLDVEDLKDSEKIKLFIKILKRYFIIYFIAIFLNITIPSEKRMYAIMAISAGETAVVNIQNSEIAKKGLEVLDLKLDSFLNELKNEKKEVTENEK